MFPMQGLNEINPKAVELEESNALALAIIPPGGKSCNRQLIK
jgi:phosphatidylinositol-binding clathrin assembly protein